MPISAMARTAAGLIWWAARIRPTGPRPHPAPPGHYPGKRYEDWSVSPWEGVEAPEWAGSRQRVRRIHIEINLVG